MISILVAAATLASPLSSFQGHWRCEGHFIASNRLIASELTIQRDPASGIFLVHHDDIAPMSYHSLEMWTVDPSNGTISAAVDDLHSGLRVYSSKALQGGVISFQRGEPDGQKDQFRYALLGSDQLQIDWSSARPGGQLRQGDTLLCRRRDVVPSQP